jgi:hypothetical protein
MRDRHTFTLILEPRQKKHCSIVPLPKGRTSKKQNHSCKMPEFVKILCRHQTAAIALASYEEATVINRMGTGANGLPLE